MPRRMEVCMSNLSRFSELLLSIECVVAPPEDAQHPRLDVGISGWTVAHWLLVPRETHLFWMPLRLESFLHVCWTAHGSWVAVGRPWHDNPTLPSFLCFHSPNFHFWTVLPRSAWVVVQQWKVRDWHQGSITQDASIRLRTVLKMIPYIVIGITFDLYHWYLWVQKGQASGSTDTRYSLFLSICHLSDSLLNLHSQQNLQIYTDQLMSMFCKGQERKRPPHS